MKEGQFCYLEENSLSSNGSGTPEVQFYNGTTWVGAENFAVSDGEITDVKVNANADIQISKLEPGTSGQIIVCDSSGVPTYVTLSVDETISNSGVITVGGNTVAIGTDTTGDYVASLVAGTGITLTNNSGESATPTIAIGQSVATTASPTFANMTLTGSVSVAGNVVSHAVPETASSLTNAVDGKILKVSGTSSSIALTTAGGSWTNGTQFTVINTNAGSLTVAAGSGTTFLAAPLAGSNVKLRAQYSTATFIYESGTGWYVIGDLTST